MPNVYGQTVIRMEKANGVFTMPCKVNGLSLKFIFDTGASDVSISLAEAVFMLKNGYLSDNELIGTEYYRIANGDIQEGTKLILREVEIGNLKLYNVSASIVHSLSAPLLLGQSALSKLGKIEFDYGNNTLTIKNGSSSNFNYDNVYSSNNYNSSNQNIYESYLFQTTIDNISTFQDPKFKISLMNYPSIDSYSIYNIPKDAIIYVLDNRGSIYYKVRVNGYTGYILRGFLKRQE